MDNGRQIVWISLRDDVPPRGYWDQEFLERLFAGRLWKPPNFHEGDGVIAVLPASAHSELVPQVNEILNQYSTCLVMLTSDEGSFFPWRELRHPNMEIWVQYIRRDRHEDQRFIPVGYPTGYTETLDALSWDKTNDVFFHGQVTNARRKAWVKELREWAGAVVVDSPGFAQGMPTQEYRGYMAASKIAACPGGILTPDTFRVWEALEAGCVPLVDTQAGEWDVPEFWGFVLGEVPFRLVEDPRVLPGMIDEELEAWPANANRLGAWWRNFCREYSYSFRDTLGRLTNRAFVNSNITVLIPTSPIPSHPDTAVLEETLGSVRERLPDSEILIMCDGVRPEQEHLRAGYQEYVRRLIWLCARRWHNVLPIVSEDWLHQANLTKRALEKVTTPFILFVEHDTPLVGEIPFDALKALPFDLIRLHHETAILAEHTHLVLGRKKINSIPIARTVQWSQRPHLAKTDFYRQILDRYFPESCRTMIEDVMHGVVQDDYRESGWGRFRLGIYTPDGDIKRSTHLDGRGAEPKFEMRFQ